MHTLLQRALTDAGSKAVAARLPALKLLGSILSCGGDADVWGPRPEDLIARAVKVLRGLANLDPSSEVRTLAEQLLEASGLGAGD